ncbi:MAG TPA: hypothetical protein VG501_10495 [Rhizomicrobium sp.]|nr:hypothetical protein [Rhizomicrobium sp.]
MARRTISLVLAVLGGRFFRKRDFTPAGLWRAFRRDRVAAVRRPGAPSLRAPCAAIRLRRGETAKANSVWRRLTLGTNRISSFGVWRRHARRAAPRVNRNGETRWHHMRGRHAGDWLMGAGSLHTSSLSNMIMSTPPVAKI